MFVVCGSCGPCAAAGPLASAEPRTHARNARLSLSLPSRRMTNLLKVLCARPSGERAVTGERMRATGASAPGAGTGLARRGTRGQRELEPRVLTASYPGFILGPFGAGTSMPRRGQDLHAQGRRRHDRPLVRRPRAKHDGRPEAYGSVDEAASALGVCRAAAERGRRAVRGHPPHPERAVRGRRRAGHGARGRRPPRGGRLARHAGHGGPPRGRYRPLHGARGPAARSS